MFFCVNFVANTLISVVNGIRQSNYEHFSCFYPTLPTANMAVLVFNLDDHKDSIKLSACVNFVANTLISVVNRNFELEKREFNQFQGFL
jgi:hypothetical protein